MKKQFVTRYKDNPILTKDDIPYPVETVHNAGVTKHDGKYVMLFRAHRYPPDYPGLKGKDLNPEKLAWVNRLYGPEAFKD